MRILLDENLPIDLYFKLLDEGWEVEHIIVLGLRGSRDSAIKARLNSEDLLFVTQDLDFLSMRLARSSVIVSRVNQSLAIDIRLGIWLTAVASFHSRTWPERIFEVFNDGVLNPVKV